MTIRTVKLNKPGQRDHYVPKLLLRQFTGVGNKLARYDRRNAVVDADRYTVDEAANLEEWDVYEARDGETREIDYRIIESRFADILERYLSQGKMPQAPDQQLIIRQMIAAQYVRSRHFLNRLRQTTRENAEHAHEVEMPEWMRADMISEAGALQDQRHWGRAFLIVETFKRALDNLNRSQLHIAQCDSSMRFHIGDSPVVPIDGNPVYNATTRTNAWTSPQYALCMPISPRYCVIAVGSEFASAMPGIDTSETILFDGVPFSSVERAFNNGTAVQLNRVSTRTICGLQDMVAIDSVYAPYANDFKLTSTFISREYPEWRSEIAADTPHGDIIDRITRTVSAVLAKNAISDTEDDAP